MKQFTSVSIFTAAWAAIATAQQTYTIDPNSVANATRSQWCLSQITACPLICLQTAANSATTLSNTCDSNSLTFSCVCANGLSPNVSQYTQTLPYFICTEWGNECVSNCGNNNQCASNCRSQHPCGAQDPVRVNTSTISSTMSATAKASGSGAVATDGSGTIYTGFAGSSATTTGGSGGAAATSHGAASSVRAAALNVGRTFGTLGVIAIVAGGFAVLL